MRAHPVELAAQLLSSELSSLFVLLRDREPELTVRGDEVSLVLEGVELVHERVEAVLDAFDALGRRAGAGPYRGSA